MHYFHPKTKQCMHWVVTPQRPTYARSNNSRKRTSSISGRRGRHQSTSNTFILHIRRCFSQISMHCFSNQIAIRRSDFQRALPEFCRVYGCIVVCRSASSRPRPGIRYSWNHWILTLSQLSFYTKTTGWIDLAIFLRNDLRLGELQKKNEGSYLRHRQPSTSTYSIHVRLHSSSAASNGYLIRSNGYMRTIIS